MPEDTTRLQAFWWALLAAVVVASLTIATWHLLNEDARDRIDGTTGYASHITELLIHEDLNHRLEALDRFARRWTEAGGLPRSNWESDAATYIEDMPGYQAIAWADATLHIRWIIPLIGNERGQDLDIGAIEHVRPAIMKARETGKTALSQPFDLALGGFGITIYTPVMRDGQFDGVIVGILRLNPWLEEIFNNLIATEHQVRVLLGGVEVYSNNPAVVPVSNEWIKQNEFSVHGLTFTTVVAPTSEFLSATQTRWSSLLLIAGLLLSALIGTSVYLAKMARFQADQLQESSRQLDNLFKNLPGMAYRWLKAPGNPMQYVSEGCEVLSGYSRSDFEEQRIRWGLDLIHPDDQGHVWKAVEQAIEAEAAFEVEYRLITRASEERWMWERGQAFKHPGTDMICIEGFITDITVRKHTESKLVAARAYSEAIIDAALEAVVTMGPDDRIKTFNREAEEMFGFAAEEVVGRSFLLMLSESTHKKYNEYTQYFKETGKLKYVFKRREMQLRRRDGSDFPAHVSVRELKDQDQQQFVFMIADISHEQAAEEEARQLREELAHVDRLSTLGEMANGIAHEINQPLTAISLFAQAGKRLLDAGAQEKLPGIFDKLSQHAQRAGAIIERVQGMARQHALTKEVVDCEALLSDVAKLAEAEARIHDIEVELEMGNGIPPVEVDVVQVQQVALNLLRNGMEAMRMREGDHGGTIKIHTSLRDDGHIEVAVIDSGCGVTEAAATKLFTPFSTTKESGMGMGLSISRAIIVAHGGQLEFHNNKTDGATFSFTLPAAAQGDRDGY